MGNQGFQGEARAQVLQSSIVQERNKASICATTRVSDNETVHYKQTYGGIPVSPSVTSHLASTAGRNTSPVDTKKTSNKKEKQAEI